MSNTKTSSNPNCNPVYHSSNPNPNSPQVRPSAIDELLERMICVAETVVEEMEESGQDAGAFEDASEELQLLRREYQGSGRAIGFGEESDNSG